MKITRSKLLFITTASFSALLGIIATGYNYQVNAEVGTLNVTGTTGTFLTPGGTWASNGKVGISTTSPNANLAIGTDIGTFDGISIGAAANRDIRIGQDSTHNLIMGWKYNATAGNAYSLLENYGGTNSLALQVTGGNVGIGTTTPAYKLQVNGSIALPDDTATGKLAIGTFGSYLSRQSSDGSTILQTGQGSLLLNPTSSNVGIGTTSPNTKLHVQGAGANGIARFTTSDYVSSTTGSGLQIETGASTGNTYTKLSAYSAGFSAWNNLILQEGGNVGIGTTDPGSYKLNVAGNLSVGTTAGATNQYLGINYGTGSQDYGAIRFYSGVTNSQTIHSFAPAWQGGSIFTTAAGSINLDGITGTTIGNWNGPDVVFSDGTSAYFKNPVGIGDTSPNYKLHVYGAGTTSTDYTNGDATGATLTLQDSGGSSGNGGQLLFAGSGGPYAGIKGYLMNGTGPAGGLILQTRTTSGNVTNRMIINHNGYIGVGAANVTPASPLHVIGPTGLRLQLDPLYYSPSVAWQLGPSSTGTNNFIISRTDNTALGMYLPYTTGTGWTTVSDKRLKTNIEDLSGEKSLEIITNIKPVTYNWKDSNSPQNSQTGFIAQQVQDVLPDIVSPFGDTTITLKNGNKETIKNAIGVSQTGLTPYMVKAIQQQQKQIEDLTNQINELKELLNNQ